MSEEGQWIEWWSPNCRNYDQYTMEYPFPPEFEAIRVQVRTIEWIGEQIPPWKDLVWPMSDRMWAFFI